MITDLISLPQKLERKAVSVRYSVKGKAGNVVMKTGATLDPYTESANSQLHSCLSHLCFYFILLTTIQFYIVTPISSNKKKKK